MKCLVEAIGRNADGRHSCSLRRTKHRIAAGIHGDDLGGGELYTLKDRWSQSDFGDRDGEHMLRGRAADYDGLFCVMVMHDQTSPSAAHENARESTATDLLIGHVPADTERPLGDLRGVMG